MADALETNQPIPFIDEPLPIREQIGSRQRFIFRFRSPWDTWQDSNQTDFEFWDKARRGKARGIELSGLLLRPISGKVSSWVLGDSPLWQVDNADSAKKLNTWWQSVQSSFLRAYQEALDLGDCYLVFNGDASITVVPPNVVERLLDPNDFQTLIGYRITTTYSEDSGFQAQTFIDEYYADHRVHTVKPFGGGPDLVNRTYNNPLKRIPVVHVANRLGVDEIFGRPLGEPLLPALHRYGDVFDAALKGNIRQGRPTPVINNMGTAAMVDEFWSRYGETETVTDPDGTQRDITVINFDPDMLLTLGGTAEFKYEAPGSFSADTVNLLGLLFYLILEHAEIPESYMGNAVSGSKASAETGVEPFLRYVKKMRGLALDWLQQLGDLYLAYLGTFDRSARGQKGVMMWKPMSAAEARLMLDSTIWLFAKKLADPVLATWLTPLGITDPEMVAKRAQEYWGDGYALGVSPSASAPASGGGMQDQFNKMTNPVNPTERAQVPSIEPVITEQNPQRNGKQHVPVSV